MPGNVPPVRDEREGLLAFLAQQRDALRFAVHGLTDEQASATPTRSALSVVGLLKHCLHMEQQWITETVLRQPLEAPVRYDEQFRLAPGETVADVLSAYAQVARRTEEVAYDLPMDHPVPVPRDVPWFPQDVEAWSLRWVLLHLIEETARHAGHADIVREHVDGSTAFQLMARAEGWEDQLRQWTSA
ncbi:DinB family protein [Thalassiella azotivora]